MDTGFLKALTEVPSVGTACGPAMHLLGQRFGVDYRCTSAHDGFCLFQKAGGYPDDLQVIFVAHVDEVGGCVYGAREEGGFETRFWGNDPEVFAGAKLQGFDYLAANAENMFPVHGELFSDGDVEGLALHGDLIRPYRTAWTFDEETTFNGDTIEGKALDPRVTAFAVTEAVRSLDSPNVGAMFVMAEECAMDVARKAVLFLQKQAPHVRLIANVDVPGLQNIREGRLDTPAIRIFEGRNFIDPSFGIHVAERLYARGLDLHLTASRTGSLTLLFTPLAPTLSIALPSEGVHLPRVQMSLRGTARCLALLTAIGEGALNYHFDF